MKKTLKLPVLEATFRFTPQPEMHPEHPEHYTGWADELFTVRALRRAIRDHATDYGTVTHLTVKRAGVKQVKVEVEEETSS